MDDFDFYGTIFNVVVTFPFMAWIALRRLAKARAAPKTIAPETTALPPHSAQILWAGLFGLFVLIEAVMIYDLFVKA